MNSTSSSPLKLSIQSNTNSSDDSHTKSSISIQRSASFNETCTVPIKITAQSKVKNSQSFGSCSLKAKISNARSSLDKKLIGSGLHGKMNNHSLISLNSITTLTNGSPTSTVTTPTQNVEQSISCLSIVKNSENSCVDYYV